MSDKRIIDLEAKQTLGSGDYLAADSAQGTYKVDANTNIMTPLTNVRNNVANSSASPDKYSSSTAYKVGDMVIQDDILYICTTACSAASWAVNSACFTATTLSSAITQLNTALNSKQNKLKISNKTVSVSFSNSAMGEGSITFSDFAAVYNTFPKSSGANDIVITRVNNTDSEIAISAYRLTGAITTSVNMTIGVIGIENS